MRKLRLLVTFLSIAFLLKSSSYLASYSETKSTQPHAQIPPNSAKPSAKKPASPDPKLPAQSTAKPKSSHQPGKGKKVQQDAKPKVGLREDVIVQKDTRFMFSFEGALSGDGKIVTDPGTALPANWKKGRVVLFPKSEDFPDGMAVKIGSIERFKDSYEVFYTTPAIDELIAWANVDEEEPLYLQSIKQFYVPPDVKMFVSAEDEEILLSDAGSRFFPHAADQIEPWNLFPFNIAYAGEEKPKSKFAQGKQLEWMVNKGKFKGNISGVKDGLIKKISFALEDMVIVATKDKKQDMKLSGVLELENFTVKHKLIVQGNSLGLPNLDTLVSGAQFDFQQKSNLSLKANLLDIKASLSDIPALASKFSCAINNGYEKSTKFLKIKIDGASWPASDLCLGMVSFKLKPMPLSFKLGNGEEASIVPSFDLFLVMGMDLKISFKAVWKYEQVTNKNLGAWINMPSKGEKLEIINKSKQLSKTNSVDGTLDGTYAGHMGIAFSMNIAGVRPVVARGFMRSDIHSKTIAKQSGDTASFCSKGGIEGKFGYSMDIGLSLNFETLNVPGWLRKNIAKKLMFSKQGLSDAILSESYDTCVADDVSTPVQEAAHTEIRQAEQKKESIKKGGKQAPVETKMPAEIRDKTKEKPAEADTAVPDEAVSEQDKQLFAMSAPWFFNGKEQGFIHIKMNQEALEKVDSSIVERLSELLNEKSFTEFKTIINPDNKKLSKFISAKVFDRSKIKFSFDEVNLSLDVKADVESAKKQSLSITHAASDKPQNKSALSLPEYLSAYTNISSQVNYQSRLSTKTSNQGMEPILSQFNNFIYYKTWAIENAYSYVEHRKPAFVYGSTRLVHDFLGTSSRLTLGDVNYVTSDFQSFHNIFGVGYSQNISSGYNRLAMAGSSINNFILRRKSIVELWVNEKKVKELFLDQGQYDLSDIPVSGGFNDIEIKITDIESKEKETLSFFVNSDNLLLNEGKLSYSYNFGLPYQTQDNKRLYAEQPMASLFYRKGITKQLTTGIYAQGNLGHWVTGLETVVAGHWGLLKSDLVYSNFQRNIFANQYIQASQPIVHPNNGYLANMQYIFSPGNSGDKQNFNLSIKYKDQNYLALGEYLTKQANIWTFSAKYSRNLTKNLGISLIWDYKTNQSTNNPTRLTASQTSNIKLSYALTRQIRINGSMHYDSLSKEARLSFIINWNMNADNNFDLNYAEKDNQTSMGWHYKPAGVVNGYSHNFMQSQTDYNRNYSLQTNYSDYLANLSFNYTNGQDKVAQVKNKRANLRLDTSLAYVKGHWGMSKPIGDSFALIKYENELLQYNPGVNPQRSIDKKITYETRPVLGNTAIVSMPAYLSKSIAIDVSQIPIRYDISESVYKLQPAYRSGSLIEIKSQHKILVYIYLADIHDQPVGLIKGYLKRLDKSKEKNQSEEPILVFSNAKGRIVTDALTAGSYELTISDMKYQPVIINVPEEIKGTFIIKEKLKM